MALSPISIYQNDQSSLAQILQGGNNTVMSILDKAVQISRDISNKQAAQERDLIGTRQQETALAQRRIENAQQDREDDRRFYRGVFESDRRAGLDERQTRVSEGGLTLRQDEAKTSREAQAAADKYVLDTLNPDSVPTGDSPITPELPSAQPSTTSPGRTASGVAKDPRSMFGPLPSAGEVAPATPENEPSVLPPPPAPPAADTTVWTEKDTRRLGELKGAVRSTKNPFLRAKAEGEIEVLEARQKAATVGNTAASDRAEKSLQMREQKAAEDKARKYAESLVADTDAFTPQVPQVYASEGNKVDLEKAEVFDKDRVASEIASAQNYSKDTYVNFPGMTLTPPQKEKRRELWEYAQSLKSGSSSASSTSPADDKAKMFWQSMNSPVK